ncbi:unnamed protein product [Owenia fusiformis]|uniref:Regucalcin n=1 Tax=Owenia fusiformis TaxID=6347 RepID=A0A8S4N3B4_OWEFU|nr:unnamed protein product [Owenia fusiformis]
MSYKVEVVPGLENITKSIGEGPHWDDATESLLFVDINDGDAYGWDSKTGKVEKFHADGTVSLIVPRKSGGYVISINKGLHHLDFETKTTTRLSEEVGAGLDARFNDGKCDPKGRIWAGTMGNEIKPAVVAPELGSLYRLDTNKVLTEQVEKVTISNGLAWTDDKKTMYYIDSIPKQIYAFDYDNDSGDISNRRVVIDFEKCDEKGVPDGMCIDTEGKLWVACYFGARIVRFDPETGKQLMVVDIPALRTTSCCFGGPNKDILYVTCAANNSTPEELEKYPLTGSVFRITGLGFKGFKANVFEG